MVGTSNLGSWKSHWTWKCKNVAEILALVILMIIWTPTLHVIGDEESEEFVLVTIFLSFNMYIKWKSNICIRFRFNGVNVYIYIFIFILVQKLAGKKTISASKLYRRSPLPIPPRLSRTTRLRWLSSSLAGGTWVGAWSLLESVLLPWISCTLGVGRSAHTIPIPWTSTHLLGFGFFVGYEIEVILGWVLTRAVIYLWGGYKYFNTSQCYILVGSRNTQ